MKTQEGGTCWVNAATTAMESSYKVEYGEEITLDPMELLEVVLGDDKAEGFFVKSGTNRVNLGGWVWQVIGATANGFGEYVLVEGTDYSHEDIRAIQKAIRENGGMNVAVNDMNPICFRNVDGYRTMNDPDHEDFDHEVVLIGYDDHFPKDYFFKEASRDGAWLAQNSRSAYWGVEGCYWISYDTPFREQSILRLSRDYQKVLAYDGSNENTIRTGDETRTANFFPEKGVLKAVGTFTVEKNQKIEILVTEADMETVICSKEAEFAVPGYHVVLLDSPQQVEDFSISVRYVGSAPVEGSSWEDPNLSYRAVCHPGESFVKIGEEWCDLSDETVKEKLSIDFTPNNCCIKALF